MYLLDLLGVMVVHMWHPSDVTLSECMCSQGMGVNLVPSSRDQSIISLQFIWCPLRDG